MLKKYSIIKKHFMSLKLFIKNQLITITIFYKLVFLDLTKL